MGVTSEAIKNIISNHFSDRPYKSFSVLFRNKARAWNINQTLARSRGKLFILTLTCNLTTILSHILFYSRRQSPRTNFWRRTGGSQFRWFLRRKWRRGSRRLRSQQSADHGTRKRNFEDKYYKTKDVFNWFCVPVHHLRVHDWWSAVLFGWWFGSPNG